MQESKRQLQRIGELQRHFLPRHLPRPAGWRLAGYYGVGHSPGGNYYDIFQLPDGQLFLLIADASDQGAPAVALVAMLRVVLHSCPLSSGVERVPFCPVHDPMQRPPHLVLGHLNQVLAENTLEEQYMTAFCGILHPAGGEFHYANAGHIPPRWWHASSRTIEPIRDACGLSLGLDRHAAYHHKRILLEPGDLLVLCSVGLTTAENGRGEIFSGDRLDDLVRDAAGQGADAVKTHVLAELEDFLAGHETQCDITLLVVERET